MTESSALPIDGRGRELDVARVGMEWTAGGLDDLGVVDLTGDLVGLFCAHRLHSFGASVWTVHPRDDVAQFIGQGLTFIGDDEREPVHLVSAADIVLDRDDEPARRLVGHVSPRAVRVVITPFGRNGPYRSYDATDLTAEAFGGALSASGLADHAPLALGDHLVSTYVGGVAAAAALAELALAEETGVGSVVDVTWVEALAASMDRRALQLLVHSYTGWDAERDDGSSPLINGLHPCADGWVYVSLYGWHIRLVSGLIGGEELTPFLTRPGLALVEPGVSVLRAAVHRWLRSRTRREAVTEAQAHGWPVTPVNQLTEALDDPWLNESALVVDVPGHPGLRLPATGLSMTDVEVHE